MADKVTQREHIQPVDTRSKNRLILNIKRLKSLFLKRSGSISQIFSNSIPENAHSQIIKLVWIELKVKSFWKII
jgi:hypothetical protein